MGRRRKADFALDPKAVQEERVDQPAGAPASSGEEPGDEGRAPPEAGGPSSVPGSGPASAVPGVAPDGETGQPDGALGPRVERDPEFENLIPPASPADEERLERQIQADGMCRDPLAVWKGRGVLLDGHTRLRICRKLGVPYTVVEVDLPDREAAMRWILRNHRARRNLTPDGLSYARGKEYLLSKRQGQRSDLAAQ